MRKILTNPFIDVYPKIDVHGEDRYSVIPIIKLFIAENIKLKNAKIVVIHGVGQGILKRSVHNYLKNNYLVNKYYLDNYNIGVTFIELNLTKQK